jgi:hypothetical protein
MEGITRDGCAPPAGGPIDDVDVQPPAENKNRGNSGTEIKAQVGRPAPDFVANGFYQGKFQQFRLSDHRGKWLVLCFYPGDFTFV